MNSDNRCPNCRSTYNPDHYRIVNAPETYFPHEDLKPREDEDSGGDESSANRSDNGRPQRTDGIILSYARIQSWSRNCVTFVSFNVIWSISLVCLRMR